MWMMEGRKKTQQNPEKGRTSETERTNAKDLGQKWRAWEEGDEAGGGAAPSYAGCRGPQKGGKDHWHQLYKCLARDFSAVWGHLNDRGELLDTTSRRRLPRRPHTPWNEERLFPFFSVLPLLTSLTCMIICWTFSFNCLLPEPFPKHS